ncbi:MAG: hypothetical protein JNN01_06170 [Opitutaceae bacterium]|nr:hypothetical protein [Opitutaceae bacterium]
MKTTLHTLPRQLLRPALSTLLVLSADGRASLLTVAPPRVASSEDRTFTDITAFARANF